jgi:IclR family transcriptional regulator, KDG regulon repressor
VKEELSKNTTKTIDNSLILLEYLSRKSDGEKITMISKDLNMGTTVIHRMLKTFKNRNFIEQDENTKRYKIGWNSYLVGITALKQNELFKLGPACIEELSRTTKETVNIVIRNGWEGIYILQCESSNSLRVANHVGSRVPLYCTAAGKILLSSMNDVLRQQYYNEVNLQIFTPNTLTSKKRIEEEVRRIKKTNLAYEWAEQALDEACVATSIINFNNDIVCAISISAPASRLTSDNLQEFTIPLLSASRKLSAKLGFVH